MEANSTPEVLLAISLQLGTAEFKKMDEPKKVGTLNEIRKTPLMLFEARPFCDLQREQRQEVQKKLQFITRK